jgi:N-acetylmuramoyl-L-alanine amidase CwlA
MPEIDIVKNSPNKSTRTGTISKILLHNTAGSFDGSVSWLCNPNARASAHLVISRTGKTAQLVKFGETAWHAGNGRVNHTSIGIEIEATNSQRGMTEAQEQKVIDWCKGLMRTYGIKAQDIIIHRMVSSTDCPVLIWPTDADFFAWRKKHLEGTVTPPKPEPKPVEKKVTWYDVFDLGDDIGIAAMAGSEPVALLISPTSLAMSKFLAEHGDHNVKAAPAGKKWPGAAKA